MGPQEIYIIDLIDLISNQDRKIRMSTDKNETLKIIKAHMNNEDFEVAGIFKVKNGEQIIKQEGILISNQLNLIDGETCQCSSVEKGFFITTTKVETSSKNDNVLLFYKEDDLIKFSIDNQDDYEFTSAFRVDIDSLTIEPMKFIVENFKYKLASALNQEGVK